MTLFWEIYANRLRKLLINSYKVIIRGPLSENVPEVNISLNSLTKNKSMAIKIH